jgi:poly-gamma-glutamate capsule biosynthesis protein CapA/YwtB (metallophosphatase superfamily)
MDYFAAGLTSTTDALTDNGIDYTGLDDSMAVREIDGVRVAVLGFSPYSWGPDIGDLDAAADLVREADEQADVVVVTMHAGAEGADKTHTPNEAEYAYGEFRGDSRAFAHAVIDAGADLVLGSGPHVVRGMERYGDGLIAYSLGNFAGWKNFNRSGDLALSGLLTVRIDEEGHVVGGRWLSLRIADPGVPRVDWDREAVALVNELSAEDFALPVLMAKDGLFELEEQ